MSSNFAEVLAQLGLPETVANSVAEAIEAKGFEGGVLGTREIAYEAGYAAGFDGSNALNEQVVALISALDQVGLTTPKGAGMALMGSSNIVDSGNAADVPAWRNPTPSDLMSRLAPTDYRYIYDMLKDAGDAIESFISPKATADGSGPLDHYSAFNRAVVDKACSRLLFNRPSYHFRAGLGSRLTNMVLVAGANAGGRPTIIFEDELHHMLDLGPDVENVRFEGHWIVAYRDPPPNDGSYGLSCSGCRNVSFERLTILNSLGGIRFVANSANVSIDWLELPPGARISTSSGISNIRIARISGGDLSTLNPAHDIKIGGLYDAAPLASPALTGNPTAPTAALGNKSKTIANTEFVRSEIANAMPGAVSASVIANTSYTATVFDTITPPVGARIAYLKQSAGVNSGIYVRAASGDNLRASDWAVGQFKAAGTRIYVMGGEKRGGSTFILKNDIVVGTDVPAFEQDNLSENTIKSFGIFLPTLSDIANGLVSVKRFATGTDITAIKNELPNLPYGIQVRVDPGIAWKALPMDITGLDGQALVGGGVRSIIDAKEDDQPHLFKLSGSGQVRFDNLTLRGKAGIADMCRRALIIDGPRVYGSHLRWDSFAGHLQIDDTNASHFDDFVFENHTEFGVLQGNNIDYKNGAPNENWQANTGYPEGKQIGYNSRWYTATRGGVTGTVPPSSQGSAIVDGEVIWAYSGDRERRNASECYFTNGEIYTHIKEPGDYTGCKMYFGPNASATYITEVRGGGHDVGLMYDADHLFDGTPVTLVYGDRPRNGHVFVKGGLTGTCKTAGVWLKGKKNLYIHFTQYQMAAERGAAMRVSGEMFSAKVLGGSLHRGQVGLLVEGGLDGAKLDFIGTGFDTNSKFLDIGPPHPVLGNGAGIHLTGGAAELTFAACYNGNKGDFPTEDYLPSGNGQSYALVRDAGFTGKVKRIAGNWSDNVAGEVLDLGSTPFFDQDMGSASQFSTDAKGKLILANYSEGTWTPGITCATPGDLAVTLSSVAANYIRQGKVVHIDLTMAVAATWTTASGLLRITGLPFVSANRTAASSLTLLAADNVDWPSARSQAIALVQANSQSIILQCVGDDVTVTNLAITALDNGGSNLIRLSGQYFLP